MLLIAILLSGCQPAASAPVGPASGAISEARPEGVGRVVEVAPNGPVGVQLVLEDGRRLAVGPAGTRTLVQTTNGPDSLAVFGHDTSGLWVLWLGLDPNRGPGCYALPRTGLDRDGFIAWPGYGFALPKSPDFHLAAGAVLGGPGSPLAGWYTGGGEAADATFCISSRGEVESVWG